MHYRIGSRGSKLALVQSELVCGKLRERFPEHTFEIIVVKTKGDKIPDKPLSVIGGQGIFVKEIEEEILNGTLDMGIHSMKDMPSEVPDGLAFTKVWGREDARDILILRTAENLWDLPEGAVIGTGSKRRACQLLALRNDLKIVDIRGNVETRIPKMEEQKLDGIVLAAAGLHRLGMQDRITQYLSVQEMLPSPAQGALALEIREDDHVLRDMLDLFANEDRNIEVETERAFLRRMGGGCSVPVGAYCTHTQDGNLCLKAMLGSESGDKMSYTEVKGNDPAGMACEAERVIRSEISGRVALVGAGPFDAGLITVRGLELLRQADCVIYDRLAAPELLNEVKQGCELIYAGKESHDHTMPQDEIEQLLMEKAMEYELVVRLKGGDPFVFGRGGEEGLFLADHGMPFTVVPGISSCIAVPELAGIPVTHRGLAQGFHVVTAHSSKDEFSHIDFQTMAASDDTCVFLMGMSKLPEIMNRLMEEGKDPATPAAAVVHGGMADQRCIVSDLAHLAEEVQKARVTPPGVLVVGNVIALRDKLLPDRLLPDRLLPGNDMAGGRENSGNVMTDAAGRADTVWIPKIGREEMQMSRLLRLEKLPVKEVQVGEIVLGSSRITAEELKGYNWVLFTSRHGVDGFFRAIQSFDMDYRELAFLKFAVVGEKCRQALRRYGIKADFVPMSENEKGLIAEWIPLLEPDDKVYYPAGNHFGQIEPAIEAKCTLFRDAVYENRRENGWDDLRPKYDPLRIPASAKVCFTCGSSVRRFEELLDREAAAEWKKKGTAYSIGPKTSRVLRELGVEHIQEADKPSYEMLAALLLKE